MTIDIMKYSQDVLAEIMSLMEDLSNDAEEFDRQIKKINKELDNIDNQLEKLLKECMPEDVAKFHASDHRKLHEVGWFKRLVLKLLGIDNGFGHPVS